MRDGGAIWRDRVGLTPGLGSLPWTGHTILQSWITEDVVWLDARAQRSATYYGLMDALLLCMITCHKQTYVLSDNNIFERNGALASHYMYSSIRLDLARAIITSAD